MTCDSTEITCTKHIALERGTFGKVHSLSKHGFCVQGSDSCDKEQFVALEFLRGKLKTMRGIQLRGKKDKYRIECKVYASQFGRQHILIEDLPVELEADNEHTSVDGCLQQSARHMKGSEISE